jgi:DNA-binding transcriptional LysR family regulator
MKNRNGTSARRLPTLDLLKGFESAARLLSFTKAGEELYLTQSAVSRQVQELEEQLGMALFRRRHRAIVLTDAGRQLYPAVAQMLADLRAAIEKLREHTGTRSLAVTSTPGFAALWLIPRLAGFSRSRPEVDVRISAAVRYQDLEREGIDVAIRYCPQTMVGPEAVRLFGERVFPVCSPKLLRDPKRPLKGPADLRHHVLLHVDDPDGRWPWQSWRPWLEVAGVPDLRPAGSLSFSGYDQVIPAAIAGHGVALGRSPLTDHAVRSGELVVPFDAGPVTDRAYWIVTSRNAVARVEVTAFVAWLQAEAEREGTRAAARHGRKARKGT